MNFILIFLITALLQLVAPWWVVSLVPFLICIWKPTTASQAFLTSFVAIAVLWFGYGLYLHVNSEGSMSNRIAEIFSLPNGAVLLIVTAMLGGLVGGFSGLSGFFLHQMFQIKRPATRTNG